MTADRRDQLASALDASAWLMSGSERAAVVDALLPAVDRMIRQAQAETWQDGYGHGRDDEANGMPIRDRAAALTTDQAAGTDVDAGAERRSDGSNPNGARKDMG